MQRRTPFALVVLSALVAGCGDDAPDAPSSGGGTKSGRPVTPHEMSEALRAHGASVDANEQALRAAEAAAAAIQASMGGGDLKQMAEKARVLGERNLTSADVETYIALIPKVRGLSGNPAELSRVLAEHGLVSLEWGVLQGRMMALRIAVGMPSDKVGAKIAADVETVRPYKDRIDAAHKAR